MKESTWICDTTDHRTAQRISTAAYNLLGVNLFILPIDSGFQLRTEERLKKDWLCRVQEWCLGFKAGLGAGQEVNRDKDAA